MQYIKKLLMLFLLPLSLNAIGLGLYIPLNFAERSTSNYSTKYSSTYIPDYSLNTRYEESSGIGFVFDTNVQQKRLFNYRLGIEILDKEIQDRNSVACQYGCNGTRLNVTHTFGFGIIRNEKIRLWVGPRINIAATKYYGNHRYSSFELEAGLAQAIGINYNINKNFSLSADLDYRVAKSNGNWDDSQSEDTYGEYSGKTYGITTRFYFIYKIHDVYNPKAPSIEDDSL